MPGDNHVVKRAKTGPVVYLDVETRRTAEDVGGWEKLSKRGVSVAVALADNQLRIFRQTNLKQLSDLLNSASLVVGYNIDNFDFKLLEAHRGVNLKAVRSLDLMWEIANVTGYRIGLSNLASATLGRAPLTQGLDLVTFWKAGKIDKVIEGCCNDVLALKAVHDHAREHGKLFYLDRNTKRRIEVLFANEEVARGSAGLSSPAGDQPSRGAVRRSRQQARIDASAF